MIKKVDVRLIGEKVSDASYKIFEVVGITKAGLIYVRDAEEGKTQVKNKKELWLYKEKRND